MKPRAQRRGFVAAWRAARAGLLVCIALGPTCARDTSSAPHVVTVSFDSATPLLPETVRVEPRHAVQAVRLDESGHLVLHTDGARAHR